MSTDGGCRGGWDAAPDNGELVACVTGVMLNRAAAHDEGTRAACEGHGRCDDGDCGLHIRGVEEGGVEDVSDCLDCGWRGSFERLPGV